LEKAPRFRFLLWKREEIWVSLSFQKDAAMNGPGSHVKEMVKGQTYENGNPWDLPPGDWG